MWDPATYLRYGDERSRPFADLVGRIGAAAPRAVVDLGCGPGTLTLTLAQRWPDARISGIDSSAEMISRAVSAAGAGQASEASQALGRQRDTAGGPISYAVGDVRQWTPESDVDVVVCNAVLQWVPGHEELLARWAARLPPGAWLALQVPGNFDSPSHQVIREVAARPGWRDRLAEVTGPRRVPDPEAYARLLASAGCAVDAWETTYIHMLAADGGDHPVLRWMEGTALRPIRSALGEGADWNAFRRDLTERLAEAYPVEEGRVYFPFRRIFAVARTPASHA